MPQYPTITLPDDPLATLRPAPPYVLVPAERFEQVKRRVGEDAELARLADGVRADALKLLDEPVLTHDIPDGRRLLWISRKAVDRITDLAFAWRMQPDDAVRDRLWAELEAVCSFPDWNPPHFLDTAEMSHAVAIGYDWLHEAWSDQQRQLMRTALIRLGIEPAMQVYRRDEDRAGHNWDTADNNWNVVCNGGIGTAALAIATDEPDLARDVLRHALPKMPICLRHFAPDGGWPEGPAYWGYTIRYFVAIIATLRTALGTDFGLSDLPGLRETAGFPMMFTSPTGRTFNFSDARVGGPIKPPFPRQHTFYYLAHLYDDPRWLQPEIWQDKPHALNALYHQPAPADPPAPPLDACYHSVEAFVLRSSWADPDAWHIAAQCGRNTVGHNQADLGTFVLEHAGVRWALDLGGDDYNLPHYFGQLRYDYYRNRAEGHNVAVIGPDASPGQETDAGGKVTRFDPDANAPHAQMDLSAAYPNARSYIRTINLRNRDHITIADDIVANQPCDIGWFWHTEANVAISGDGQTATLSRRGRKLRLRLESQPKAVFAVTDARPLATSPDPPGQNPNNGSQSTTKTKEGFTKVGTLPVWGEPDPSKAVRKLAIHFKDVSEVGLSVTVEAVE